MRGKTDHVKHIYFLVQLLHALLQTMGGLQSITKL